MEQSLERSVDQSVPGGDHVTLLSRLLRGVESIRADREAPGPPLPALSRPSAWWGDQLRARARTDDRRQVKVDREHCAGHGEDREDRLPLLRGDENHVAQAYELPRADPRLLLHRLTLSSHGVCLLVRVLVCVPVCGGGCPSPCLPPSGGPHGHARR